MIVKVAALRANDRKFSTSGHIPYESRPFSPRHGMTSQGELHTAQINTKLPNSPYFANNSGSLRL